jgi:16S rRNA (guanine966-N2)-methyltransferase
VRVVGGSAGGTRLAPVPAGTRPLSDRAREGLFSSLGRAVVGARVLDLFAGTGALGIEALSRGAERCVFVDSAPGAVRAIRDNLRRTRLEARAEVRRWDALRALERVGGPFHLVLADPPYGLPPRQLDRLFDRLAGGGLLVPGARVVLTRPKGGYMPVIPVHWQPERRLVYGDTVVVVLRTPRRQGGLEEGWESPPSAPGPSIP